ncbi:MAG: oxygen-independent coproporphyrinogen III oxidase [Methyloceanibacter sp.]|nr:oxygen-independent coproporphyrinogen III oxidase [Methyloceanibacter sp.]
MIETLAKYATRNVPRYTSYPTVPHFSDAVGADDYAAWLAAIDLSVPLSLYLHVPFCRQLCWYCGCNMKLATREEKIAQYAATLRREIALVADRLPGRAVVSHLHWGGGTPTTLSPRDLEDAMDDVRRTFDFAPGAEIAFETDPRTLKAEMVATIGHLGFTRASIGVQEFDPQVQAAINRIQPPEMVQQTVDMLHNAGVGSINFDLIYGLPHQTVDKLLRTIELCISMKPNRIALFGYAHVPWMAKKQRLIDEAALPGSSERMRQARASAKALTDAGYVAIGLDHFALPGDPMANAVKCGNLRRNFQGYTMDQAKTLLGLGATSIGRTPSGYVQNIAEPGAWARAVEGGILPIAKGHAFAGEDALRGYVIERLMCAGSVDLEEAARRFNNPPNWYQDIQEDLTQMVSDGVITQEQGRIRITESGAPALRVIASLFDAYLGANARHAIAV